MSTLTAPVRLPRPPATRRAWGEWAPLAILMCGTFMYVLDFFVVNVAMPSIERGLHATPADIEWVVAGYGLAIAAFLVLGGRLGDIAGRRRIFALGLGVFAVCSAACALSPDPVFLIVARLAQGVGAGLMAPNILSILGVVYTEERRVRAIAIYGMVMGVAAVSGQLIGGLLIDTGLGWRSIFWVNVPIGLVALIACRSQVPESRSGEGRSLDLVGSLLLSVALVAVVLPLVTGRDEGWPAWSWACLAASPVLFAGFFAHQRWYAAGGRNPVLDPKLFAVGAFRAGLGTQLAFWCQQAASYLVLALYLQQGRGLSPLSSGAVFAVLAAGYLLTSLRAPALTVRFGRSVIAVGAVVAALGNGLLWAVVAQSGTGGALGAVLPGLFLVGAGQGLCITPLTTTVLSHADPVTAGAVSGALSTMQQVGNSIGVAVIGVLFFGAVHHGYGVAFERSVAAMLILLAGVAVLTRLLPKQTVRS
ncbi:MAG: MFS transporter [Acidimicrobiaceae bacterium]|nr:MFS transporter [Acidimicrobiaceae bacterium]